MAEKSASARSVKRGKKRGAKTAPEEAGHLTNQNVRRMRKSAPRAALRFKKVVDMQTEPLNNKYFVNQTVLTFNAMKDPPNVGGSKSKKTGKKKRERTEVEMVTTDGDGFSKEQQMLLYRGGFLNGILDVIKQDIENETMQNPPSTPVNVKKFNTPEAYEEHLDRNKKKRSLANKERSQAEVKQALGSKVKTYTRKSWGKKK